MEYLVIIYRYFKLMGRISLLLNIVININIGNYSNICLVYGIMVNLGGRDYFNDFRLI